MADIRLNEKQIIRAALTISGKTQKEVCEGIGINPNTLKNQLCRPESTMTLISVYKLLAEMGFEIVVRDADGRYGNREFTISAGDEAIDAERFIPDKVIEEAKADLPKAEPRKEIGKLPESKVNQESTIDKWNRAAREKEAIRQARMARLDDDSLFGKE